METEKNETGIGNSLFICIWMWVAEYICLFSADQTTVIILYHSLHLYINAYIKGLENTQGLPQF